MLNDDLLDAVKKNLPAVAATELAKYIEQAERDKESLTTLSARITKLESENSALQARVTTLDALNLRKEAVDEQERNLKVVLADAKAEQAEKRSQAIFDLVGIVFKNPVVRQHTFGSMPVAQGRDQYGSLQPIVPSPFNQSVETDIEGTK